MSSDDRPTIKVVSYIRESTRRQSVMGYRPAYQRKVIEVYCQRHGFEIVEKFEDSGSGGSVKKRPNFQKMIQLVNESEDIKFIVIQEVSRFFRNVESSLGFERELEEQGIYVVDTAIDYSPRDYLERGISYSQWGIRAQARIRAEEERRMISDRVSEGYAEKTAKRQWVGQLPFGTEWKDDNTKYIGYKEDEAAIVKEIFKLYATGRYGYTTLARRLNELGYTRTLSEIIEKEVGGDLIQEKKLVQEPFTNDIIRSITHNRVYIGLQNYGAYMPLRTLNDSGLISDLQPLISVEEFNYVQSVILSKTRGGKETKNSNQTRTYLLQGNTYSAVNDVKFSAQTDTSGKTDVRRYVASSNKKGNKEKIPSVRADEAESALIDLLVHVKIEDLEHIKKRLRESISVEPNKVIERLKKPENIKNMEAVLKDLKERQKSAYSSDSDILIQGLERQLNEAILLDSDPKAKSAQFYDLLELDHVISNIHKEFTQMQSLAAKKELVNVLFSELFLGQRKYDEGSPAEKFSGRKGKQILSTRAVPLHEEAKELKAYLEKFMPALFEKIYINNEKEILEVTVKPTGLFMLLTDKEERPLEERGTSKKNS